MEEKWRETHLKLNHIDATFKSFRVDDDLHVQGPLLDDSLDCRKADPQVVRVEDVEFFDRFEVLDFVFRDLGYFQKSQMILKFKKRWTNSYWLLKSHVTIFSHSNFNLAQCKILVNYFQV